jgi:hypothetical protein
MSSWPPLPPFLLPLAPLGPGRPALLRGVRALPLPLPAAAPLDLLLTLTGGRI